MKSSYDVTGMDAYIENLLKAGKDVDLVARDALEESAQVLKAEMISRVPKAEGVNAEILAEHITIKTPTAEGHYNYVNVGILHDINYTPKGVDIHAKIVEFGSVWTPARPFIRPAVASARARVNNLIRARLQAAGLVDG